MDHSITHIRPRFKVKVAKPSDRLLAEIKDKLADTSEYIEGQVVHDQVFLDIHKKHLHYWSPHLTCRIEPDEEQAGYCLVSGLIGPRPPVWTLFMFIYFSVGTVGFFMSSYGISKYILGDYSPLVWSFPVAVLFMLTAYKAGKYGEQLGKDQIDAMKTFLKETFGSYTVL